MRRHRLIVVLVVAMLVVLAVFLYPRRSHFHELPNPNGYDALVHHASRISRNYSDLKEMTSNQLAELVTTNEAVVKDIRAALNLKSVVPVQTTEGWIATQTTQLMNLKASAQAMDAEAYCWQQKGDYTKAMALCLDEVRFSHATMRGGVLINYLVGSACETIAVRRMTNFLLQLNSLQCKEAARLLEEIDSQRESFEKVSARELEWQRKTHSVFVRLKEGFKKHVLGESDFFSALAGDPKSEYQRRTLEVRRLFLNLARRAYELETGSSPSQISTLIPAYLSTIPRDPGTGAMLDLP